MKHVEQFMRLAGEGNETVMVGVAILIIIILAALITR